MKKLLFTALLLTISVLFASCRKDYTCDCDGVEYTISNANRVEAKTLCAGTDCKLK